MKDLLKKQTEFQTAFEQVVNTKPTSGVGYKEYVLRHKLMEEENNEYLEAAMNNDLESIADALGDKLAILLGTIITHGLQDLIVPIFHEIHKSNMSKLEDGIPKRREDGKALKGRNYSAPNLKQFFLDYYRRQHLQEE